MIVKEFVEGKFKSIVSIGLEDIRENEATLVIVVEYQHPRGYVTHKRYYFTIQIPPFAKIPIYEVR